MDRDVTARLSRFEKDFLVTTQFYGVPFVFLILFDFALASGEDFSTVVTKPSFCVLDTNIS